jgi:hypothetical protein
MNRIHTRTEKQTRYVDYTEFCLKLAKEAKDQDTRVLLREMATEWLRLAELVRSRLI